MGVLSSGNTKLNLFIKNETETIKNKIAQYPVQRGQPLVDHTQRESKAWTFEGLLFGRNQSDIDAKFNQLLTWQQQGTLLTYNGAIHHGDLLITDLEKVYDEGGYRNAIKISISLLHVRVVSSSFVKAVHVGPKAPTKPVPPGVWVTVRAGNTYWGWWMQYGTPIQTLRNWNHWPDRQIPIGVRARVK